MIIRNYYLQYDESSFYKQDSRCNYYSTHWLYLTDIISTKTIYIIILKVIVLYKWKITNYTRTNVIVFVNKNYNLLIQSWHTASKAN